MTSTDSRSDHNVAESCNQAMKKTGATSGKRPGGYRIALVVAGWGLVALALHAAIHYNYLLFHTLAEFFSSVIGLILFVLVWNARRWMDNYYFFALGTALAAVGCLDIAHALASKGMNFFPGYDGNLSIQLWIAARYLQALSMLFVPLLLPAIPSCYTAATEEQNRIRRMRESAIVALYVVVTMLAMVFIFKRQFPVCYIEGQGLTPFGKASEYVITLILLVSLGVLWNKKRHFDLTQLWLLLSAIGASALSELAFALNTGRYDFSNQIGQFGKIAAFYLIYVAVVQAGLKRPYGLMFKNLNQYTEALRESEAFLRATINALKNPFAVINADNHTVQMANNAFGGSAAVGKKCYSTVSHDQNTPCNSTENPCPIEEVRRTGHPVVVERIHTDGKGNFRHIEVHAGPVFDENGRLTQIIKQMFDITEHKRAEHYRSLSNEVLAILNVSDDFKYSIRSILATLKKGMGLDAVGIHLHGGDDFPYATQYGFSGDFLLTKNGLIDDQPDDGICRWPDGSVMLECTCGLVLSGKTDPSNPMFTKGGSFWPNGSSSFFDLSADVDRRLNQPGRCLHQQYTSVALVPLKTRDKIIGLIQFNDHRKGRFSLDTVQALEGIAGLISGTFLRKYAEATIRHEAAVNRALSDIAKALTEPGSSMASISNVVYDYALHLTGSAHGYVSSIDPETGENVGHTLSSMMDRSICQVEDKRIAFPRGENGYNGLYGHSLNTFESFFTNAPGAHPAAKGLPDGHVPLERFLSVPAVYEGKLYGQIALANSDRDYCVADLDMVAALAHLFAMAIFRKRMEDSLTDNERRLKKAHQLLEERVMRRTQELSEANAQLTEEMAERRRTLDALSRSEERYRSIIQTAMDGFWLVDLEGNLLKVNDTYCRMSGYSAQELQTMNILDLDTEESMDDMADHINKVIMQGEDRFESRHRRKDGSLFTVEIAVQFQPAEGGRIVVFLRDITELKHWQTQILHSKKMLQTVFDGIVEPLLFVDKEMNFKMINTAALQHYRLDSPHGVIGRPVSEVLVGHKDRCAGCPIPKAVLEGRHISFIRKGSLDPSRVESVAVFPISSEDEADSGAVIRITDITEASMMEKSLQRTQKLASIGVLSSGVAHEINNPNNFIMFNIPVLRRYLAAVLPIVEEHTADSPPSTLFGMSFEEFKEDLFELLKSIETGSERIKNIVSELKEFSSLGDQQEMTWGNPEKTILQAVRISRVQLKDSIRHLEVDIGKNLPDVYFEARGLEQVIVNILINAAQAADKEDSRISLKTKVENGDSGLFVVEIVDNGCGMDEKSIGKIFDPFYTTKPPGVGTGLGLYVCHSLMEKMEGRLDVMSDNGEGSTFRIILTCRRK